MIESDQNDRVINCETYKPNIDIIPRTPDIFPDSKEDTGDWNFEESAFANYRRDTPFLMKRCFKFDYSMCKSNF